MRLLSCTGAPDTMYSTHRLSPTWSLWWPLCKSGVGAGAAAADDAEADGSDAAADAAEADAAAGGRLAGGDGGDAAYEATEAGGALEAPSTHRCLTIASPLIRR